MGKKIGLGWFRCRWPVDSVRVSGQNGCTRNFFSSSFFLSLSLSFSADERVPRQDSLENLEEETWRTWPAAKQGRKYLAVPAAVRVAWS